MRAYTDVYTLYIYIYIYIIFIFHSFIHSSVTIMGALGGGRHCTPQAHQLPLWIFSYSNVRSLRERQPGITDIVSSADISTIWLVGMEQLLEVQQSSALPTCVDCLQQLLLFILYIPEKGTRKLCVRRFRKTHIKYVYCRSEKTHTAVCLQPARLTSP